MTPNKAGINLRLCQQNPVSLFFSSGLSLFHARSSLGQILPSWWQDAATAPPTHHVLLNYCRKREVCFSDSSHKHPRNRVSLALIVLTLHLCPSLSSLPTLRKCTVRTARLGLSHTATSGTTGKVSMTRSHRFSATETVSAVRAEFTSGIYISHITTCLESYNYWYLSHASVIQGWLEL